MQTFQQTALSLPLPSTWGIIGEVAGRRLVRGVLVLQSISNNIVRGTINFRGTDLPISGTWDENTRNLVFNSPFASFSGQLLLFDQTTINIRHFILNGRFIMNPPSLQAGEFGQWVALTGTTRIGPPQFSDPIPTTAVFLLSNILYGDPQHFR
ncbi:hypothetical protein HXA34_05035 [Salipaludibacillus agaradhaerens]|uniref:hypothetical protein n=1 Tax=Salipaludibacillus agaradhaerens TaxID=76935 RepID=UPI002151B2EA|nr:hypothetical protein [Salipaludibacillus agaradhaerens]MCR6105652.1 hypothetical protein [Salipaludibacillus agaradhaerens]MCR6117689.1 hypothetical protein [Salipaludibacillus agaradhaerens]